MIAIKSKKDLMFPPSYRGIVTMKIDLIQNKPEEEVYELRIIDTCMKGEDSQKGNEVVRFKTMTYDELDQLAAILNVDMSDKTKLRENINELFRQGLFAITQQECLKGEGMYFSEVQDWEIVR